MKKTPTAKKPERKTQEMGIIRIDQENIKNLYNYYSTEISGLTTKKIHWYLDVARKGVNFWKSLMFEEIRRRDLRMGGICQTRKLAVANQEWELKFEKDAEPGKREGIEKIKMLEKLFEKIGIENFFSDIVECELQGVSTFELLWEIVNNKMLPTKIEYIQNHLLCYDDINNEYRYLDLKKADANQMRSLGWQTMQTRIDFSKYVIEYIHPMKLIEVHSFDGNEKNGLLNGCIDGLIWAYMFKSYGLKDWAVYIERYAIPSIIGKYPQLMTGTDRANFQTAVMNYGNSFKLVIPQEADVKALESTSSTTNDAFSNYVKNYWNEEMTIRVLGQSLTTSQGNVGSQALGKVHDKVREDLVLSDMKLVKNTMNRLIERIFELNYGEGSAVPKFTFKKEKDIEYKKKRSAIMRDIKTIGYRVKKENVEDEFGVEVEEDKEPIPDEGGKQYVDKFIDDYFKFIEGNKK